MAGKVTVQSHKRTRKKLLMRLDSYAIRLSLLALSRHVPPGPGVLPLSGRHGVAPGVEDKGSRGDPAPEHVGEESRRETSLVVDDQPGHLDQSGHDGRVTGNRGKHQWRPLSP